MVDITNKKYTLRVAKAIGIVKIKNKIDLNLIKKGNLFTISKVAGINATKLTHNLIPLCHNININYINLNIELKEDDLEFIILSEVKAYSNTGVEIEALMAVSISSLTIIDMIKSTGLNLEIKNIKIIQKTGGKSDFKE